MKKRTIALFSLLVCAVATQAQSTNPAPYCAAGYDDGFAPIPHYATRVSLGTLDNASSANASFAAPHYVYYNNVTAPNLAKGRSYSLSVTHDGGFTIHWVAVYIDFNHNNSFDDAGERVLEQTPGTVTNPSAASITIPATAVAGTTRMRVMVFEDDMFTGSNPGHTRPCTADNGGSFDWGETEDYNVNITGGGTDITALPEQAHADLVYPNPAKGVLWLKKPLQDAVAVITDVQGRVVSEQRTTTAQRIDISTLRPGLYCIKIARKDGVSAQTFVVEK